MSSTKRPVIFLLGGQTGGPIVPLMAWTQFVPECNYKIVGVRGGFEEDIAREKGLQFLPVPKAKQYVQNTHNVFLRDAIANFFRGFVIAFQLFVSLICCAWYCIRYRPIAVVTAGSFVGVPMSIMVRILKKLGLSIQLIVHQQDVIPTKSNLIAAKFADFVSITSEETRNFSPVFKQALVTVNPIETVRFSANKLEQIRLDMLSQDPELYSLLHSISKPLLFVFGGGSGAQYINDFVSDNLEILLDRFNIIHLTGKQKKGAQHRDGYSVREQFSLSWQSYVLTNADVIISRAGIGTICELVYLAKTAFLLPIPYTHQEKNAEFYKDRFGIWKYTEFDYNRSDMHEKWVEDLLNVKIKKRSPVSNKRYEKALQEYFGLIRTKLQL